MKATTGHIWEAASKDASRPALVHVQFDAEKATLTATNSYIAARVPCEIEEGDESGLIPAAAIKEAKGRSLRIADGKATLKLPDGGERSWPLYVGQFPDIDVIMADATEADIQVGVNPDLVQQLGSALGAGGKRYIPLVLHPRRPLAPMRVETGLGGSGVLMPVRLASTNGHVPVGEMLANDDAVLAAFDAATRKIQTRRGRKAALAAFRKTLETVASAA